mmetsp:Transcript_13620/g.39776  ORF Transcript_13620/g.39776 Transcript_13620/m.39776 type:complete len:203 (-) Transcript_13620:586-1194(-)
MISLLLQRMIHYRHEDVLEVAADLIFHPVLDGLSEELHVSDLDEGEDLLVPDNGRREEELVRPHAAARALNELCHCLVRLELHAQREQNGVLHVPSQLLLQRLEHRHVILVGVDTIHLLQVLRRRRDDELEERLFVRPPSPLTSLVKRLGVLLGLVLRVQVRVVRVLEALDAGHAEIFQVATKLSLDEASQILLVLPEVRLP